MKMPGSQNFWNWAPVLCLFPFLQHLSLLAQLSQLRLSLTNLWVPADLLSLNIQVQAALAESSTQLLFLYSLFSSPCLLLLPPIQNAIVSRLVFWNDLLVGPCNLTVFSFPDANISQHGVNMVHKAGLEPPFLKVSLASSGHYNGTGLHHKLLPNSYFMFGWANKQNMWGSFNQGDFIPSCLWSYYSE